MFETDDDAIQRLGLIECRGTMFASVGMRMKCIQQFRSDGDGLSGAGV
jgi:hypothetical protein